MKIVGIDFRDGILFVPEVLLAANAMKAGMFILKPLLVETGAPRMGKMVIGTVTGVATPPLMTTCTGEFSLATRRTPSSLPT